MRKKSRKPTGPITPKSAQESTREALEFCFEDVSSLRMIGAAPLSDLSSGRGPAPASGAGPGAAPRSGHRWPLLVLLALLLLTLGATTAATLLGR